MTRACSPHRPTRGPHTPGATLSGHPYGPETHTGTEPDIAREVRESVVEVRQPERAATSS